VGKIAEKSKCKKVNVAQTVMKMMECYKHSFDSKGYGVKKSYVLDLI